MSPLWVVLAATIVIGDCRRAHSNDALTNCINKDVDTYLDQVLEKARAELPDPMRLPPKSTVVELRDGLMWGMSDLARVGSAKVTCKGNAVTIEAKLTTEELKGRYTWTKERKTNDPREGYVVIISDDFEVDITLVIEKKENEVTHPRLERLVIKKFKDAKIEITGGGFLTWALGEFSTLMSGIFQRAIAHAVEDPMTEALERQMREISLH